MGVKLDQEGVMRLLDKLYEQATQGIAMVSPPIEETAGDYLRKNPDIDTAAKNCQMYYVRILGRSRWNHYASCYNSSKCEQCSLCSDAHDCRACVYGRL